MPFTKICHISPVLKDLYWLPIKYRAIFKITLLVFKVLHGLAPSYLENVIRVKSEGRYHLRNKDQLFVPRTKCKKFEHRAFFKSEPVLWNSLPDNLRQITNIQKFKKELKTVLFELVYQWATVIYCQLAIRAKTRGWRGGSIIEPCESTVQAEKISSDLYGKIPECKVWFLRFQWRSEKCNGPIAARRDCKVTAAWFWSPLFCS